MSTKQEQSLSPNNPFDSDNRYFVFGVLVLGDD
jgi:hypothetical protein